MLLLHACPLSLPFHAAIFAWLTPPPGSGSQIGSFSPWKPLSLSSLERGMSGLGVCPHPGIPTHPTPSPWDIRLFWFSTKVLGEVTRYKVQLGVEEVLSCGQT